MRNKAGRDGGDGDAAAAPALVRPHAAVVVLGALMVPAALFLGARGMLASTGRTDAEGGVLPEVLRAHASVHAATWTSAWESHVRSWEPLLRALAAAAEAHPPPPGERYPAFPRACSAWERAPGHARAGVVHVPTLGLRAWLAGSVAGRCVDAVATAASADVDGPPFHVAGEHARLVQAGSAGVALATENPAVVHAWRDGTRAMARVALRTGSHVAWVDVDVGTDGPQVPLPPAPVRVDAWWTLDGVPSGFVVGGPARDALPDALAGVRDGDVRALDLPDLARAAASPGALAAADARLDDGAAAFGVVQRPLIAPVQGLQLHVVASAPAPARLPRGWANIGTAAVMLLAGWFALCAWWLRPLGVQLRALARATQAAWLGLREDDVGSAEDARRARQWMSALGVHVEGLLVRAFGRNERFWAPSPMERLLRHAEKRLSDAEREAPPGGTEKP